VHRFFRFRRLGQHVAPTSGSMGYGVPAAIGIKRLYPSAPSCASRATAIS